MHKTIPISVVILTHNEAANIEWCLDSLSWSNDVVVLDSFSTDGTPDLAKGKGARVMYREFDNYAAQRNYVLKEIDYKNFWILMLDADEVVPPELAEEMNRVVKEANHCTTMFRLRRKDFFMGTWLKYSCNYSSFWMGRLFRAGHVYIERSVNEEYYTDGIVERLEHSLLHFPFNKGINHWIDKHNRYSSMEADLVFRKRSSCWHFADLFRKDPVIRRKNLKALMFTLPGRPLLMFLGRYFVCGGFLDGWAGLTFCILKTYYEYMIDCKIRELHFSYNKFQKSF